MTPAATMSERRFAWLLQTRGPGVAAWPGPERDAALQLLRHNDTARQSLADSLAAEDAPGLDSLGPDCAVLARMQGVVRRALAPPPPVIRGMRWGALAAFVAAGLYLGVLNGAPAADPFDGSALAPTIQATVPATVLAALDP